MKLRRKKADLSTLSADQNMRLGMLAGICTNVINYPLLTWKNLHQQGIPISYKPKVMYCGLPISSLTLGGTTACQFGFTNIFTKLLTNGGRDHVSREINLLSSFLGGLVSGIPCSILELTMI